MILILSNTRDEHARIVGRKLRERGAEVLDFDPASIPSEASLAVHLEGARRRVTLRYRGATHDLGRVTAVWDRRPGVPGASSHLADDALRRHARAEHAAVARDAFAVLEDCLFVPAPRAGVLAAQRKGLQLGLAQRLGFELPDTLITADVDEVLEFHRRHDGDIVSKSFDTGYVRRPRAGGEPDEFAWYTQRVRASDLVHLHALAHCPMIFQAYVPKALELRVTVVGRRVFAAEIHSQASARTREDWKRYDLAHTPHRPHALPEPVAERCRRLLDALELQYGAIDLVLTPDGRYVFLEINPSGQWFWIESLTHLPISDAMADLLARGRAEHP